MALASVALALAACSARPSDPYQPQAALFSWDSSVMVDGGEELLATMDELGLDALYQQFPSGLEEIEALADFLDRARESAIEVYVLDGDPHWGLDPEGRDLREAVGRVINLNEALAESSKIADSPQLAGIVLDVEPYLLDEWNDDPEDVLEAFAAGLDRAHQLASTHDLELVLCIPHFYDREVGPELLEALIVGGCDQLAVMNYGRGREVANLSGEARIARKLGKDLITIYELQPPDGHSVEEGSTYWAQGIDAVWSSYQTVREAYPEQTISIALHDYEAVRDTADSLTP